MLADSFAGLVWRVDLGHDGHAPQADVWLSHPSMAHDPDSTMKPAQPGVNGIRFAAAESAIFYTSTAQKLFMRVSVDPTTHEPAGEPELIASGRMSDDFCIDEDASVAYVTTHRENTIDRVPLTPAGPEAPRRVVAGDPFDPELVGPSSGVWGRDPGDYGRIAYFATDGGSTAPPPDGIVRARKSYGSSSQTANTSDAQTRRVLPHPYPDDRWRRRPSDPRPKTRRGSPTTATSSSREPRG